MGDDDRRVRSRVRGPRSWARLREPRSWARLRGPRGWSLATQLFAIQAAVILIVLLGAGVAAFSNATIANSDAAQDEVLGVARAVADVPSVASALKRWLRGTYCGAIDPEHLAYYLDEFNFRANSRRTRTRGQLFHVLLSQAMQCSPMSRRTPRAASRSTTRATVLDTVTLTPDHSLGEGETLIARKESCPARTLGNYG